MVCSDSLTLARFTEETNTDYPLELESVGSLLTANVAGDCSEDDDVISASVTRRQYKEATGTSPSATFNSAPIVGNLLVVIAGHRKDAATPTISGSGWTQHISFDVFSGMSNNRRGMTIWTKIAGPNEPPTITTSVGSSLSKLLIQEFSVTGGSFTAMDQTASNPGTTSPSTWVSTGTTPSTTSSNTLVVAAMIGRYSAGNTPNFGNGLHSSVGSNDITSDYPSMWSGFVHRTSTGIENGGVSWSSSIQASAGVIAYGISVGSNGGSGTDCPGRVSSGLVALYDFSEGSGNVVNDISGYGTPLDLIIANPSNTSWLSGDCGLSVNSTTLLESSGNASKISTACKSTNEYSLEIWAKAANTTQGGPSRLIEMGDGNGNNRNFMFGPDFGTEYESRFRTTSNPSGYGPPLNGGTPNTSLNHYVVTRNSGGVERMYLNGTQIATQTIGGNLSNWTDSYTLQVANRDGLQRPWLGQIYKVAIYNKDLSSSEVLTNYNQGECCIAVPENCSNNIDDDGDGLIDCNDPDCSSYSGCSSANGCDLTIKALGSCGGEFIDLRLDGVTVATYTLTTSFVNYTYSGYADGQDVSIYFYDTNPGCDHNARIDHIVADGSTYQMENATNNESCNVNGSEWMWCSGTAYFGSIPCSQSGGGITTAIPCTEGQTVDHYGEGCSGSNINISVPNLSNVDKTIIEVVYKSCNPGSSVTVSSSIGNISLPKANIPGGSSNVRVYRTEVNQGVTNITATSACGTCGTGNGLQSLLIYAVRNVDTGVSYQTTTTAMSDYCGVETLNIPISTSTAPRDIKVVLPLSEITNDGRYLTVEATSNIGSAFDSETIYGPDLSLGCCFYLMELTLVGVPANATVIELTIKTDGANNPTGTSCGQSYVIGGTTYTEIECSCVDITANAGPNVSICSGDNTALTGSATGGYGGTSFSWSPATGLSATNIATPLASPASTTTYTLTVTGSDGCSGTDQVVVTVVTNFTNGGTISGDQLVCGGYNPTNIANVTSPAGGSGGTPYYVWQKRDKPCGGSYSSWSTISGANSLTYDPPAITTTTQYRRIARRISGCSPTWVYSNTVTKTVVEQFISGGTVAGDQTNCGSYDPATITSATTPTGGCEGSTTYRWQSRTKNCGTGIWTGWANITVNGQNATYNPPTINVTTQYRRVAWRAGGCTPGNVISNVIEKTVIEDLANGGSISADQSGCGAFNPVNIVGTVPSGACTTQGIDYQWQKREAYGGPWTDIAGATGQNYNPPLISVTTQYQRIASTEVCGDLVSNYVTMTINNDPVVVLDDTDFCPGTSITLDPEVCVSYPDIVAIRPHDNTGWNNQYNQGGTALIGDGKLCFDLSVAPNNSYNMIGLNSDPDANASFTSIDYALYIIHTAGNYRVRPYENGVNRGDKYSSTTSYVGSTFCIERIGTTITYLMDGNLLHTSTIGSTANLYFDNSIHSSGVQHAEFNNIQLCGPASSLDANYNWSTGVTSNTIAVSTTGTYTVTVTDDNGCSDTDAAIIGTFTPPTAAITKDGDLACNDGTVRLTANPAGMTYAWSGGGSSRTKDVTTSGTHTVTVTDGNGCTDVASISVIDNTTPTSIFCERYRIYDNTLDVWGTWTTFSGNCTIEMCENAGTDHIQFDGGPNINTGWVWTDEDGIVDSEVDEIVQFNNIGASDAGTYTGVLTNVHGCVSTVTFDVVVHANPTVTFNNQTVCEDALPLTLTPTVSGGSGGYTITWDNGLGTGASKSVSPVIGTTTYNITVSDSEGCETIDQATITVNPQPIAIPNNNINICSGLTQTHTATDAGVGATYSWNFGALATPSTATGIGPHTVTYNLSDPNVNLNVTTSLTVNLNGCTEVGTDVFTLLAIPQGTLSSTQPTCDSNDGSVTITFNDSPSRTGIDFSIDGGTTWPAAVGDNTGTYTFNNLAPGTYDVWARWGDDSCPIDFGDVTLNPLSSTPVFCQQYRIYDQSEAVWSSWVTFSGNCTIELCEDEGLDDIQFDGGPNVNTGWVWTDEDGNIDSEVDEQVIFSNIDVSDAGTYTGVLTNASGCTSTVTFDVIVNANPIATATNDGPITCADGTVTMTANPAGMTYTWSGGGTGRTKNVTTAGTYTVTVTDTDGCSSTAQTTVTNNLTPPTANAGPDKNICGGDNTSLTASGGSTYSWSTGATTATISVSPTAYREYHITVTGSNGCTDTDNVIVNVEQPSTTPFAGEDVDICPGESVTLSVNEDLGTGGFVDYSTWTTGTGNATGFSQNGSTTENHRINGLDPWGNTTVLWEARPDSGWNGDGGWNSSIFDIDHTKTYRVSVWVNRKVLGTDGRFYLGTSAWGSVNGVRNVSNNALTTNPYFETSNTPPTEYGEGQWVLVVGHIHPSSYNSTSKHPDSGVYNTYSGKIHETLRDYKWLPESLTSRHRSYLFYTTDVSVRQQWVYPRFDLVDGTEPSIDDLLSGYDANAGLGDGANWQWYTGSCGGTSVGSGTQITVNPSATTTYYVRGEGNCNDTACDQVTVTVNTPPTAAITKDGDITCDDGTVRLTATPAGMTYAWSGGGSSQTKDITAPGSYSVTVTDGNGCTDVASISVIENTTPTSIFCERYRIRDAATAIWGPWTTFSGNCTIELCENGGLDDIQFDGGPNVNTGWVWKDEDGNTDSEVDEVVQFDNIGANDAGTYTGVLTNEYGCTSTITFDVVVHANPTVAFNNQTICEDALPLTLTPSVSGGSGGYTITWDNGLGTGASKSVSPVIGTTIYNITVSDSEGCETIDQATITVNPQPTAIPNNNINICSGLTQTHTATDAGVGATYSWNFGALASPSTATGIGPHTVTYNLSDPNVNLNITTSLTVTHNGCTEVGTDVFTLLAIPQGTLSSTQPTCDSNDGIITITFNDSPSRTGIEFSIDGGATWPSTASVGDNSGTYTFNNLAPGTYDVWARWGDDSCPIDFGDVTLNPLSSTPVFCQQYRIYDQSEGVWSSWVTFSGNCTIELCEDEGLDDIQFDGGPNVNTGWVWTDEDGNIDSEVDEQVIFSNIDVSDAGTYTGVLTNASGCTSTVTFDVIVNANPNATATNDGPITCADGTVTMTANPAGMTYAWNGGGTGRTKNVTAPGTYTVTVTDVEGCSSTAETIVTEDVTPPTASVNNPDICIGDATTITATGGVSYSWSTSASTATINVSPAATATYTVTVTGANGCTSTATSTVTVNSPPNNAITKLRDISCTHPLGYIYANVSYTGSNTTYADNSEIIVGGGACGNNYLSSTGVTPYSIIAHNMAGAVTAGTEYEFSLKYKSTGTATKYFRINYYNSSWQYIGNHVQNFSNNINTWTDISVSGLAPANASNVQISMIIAAVGEVQTDCWDFRAVGSSTPIYENSFETASPYSWSGPNGNAGISRGIYVTVPGTYTVTITDPVTGCVNTNSIVVAENTAAPDLTASNDGPITCANTIVNLTASSQVTGATYEWSNSATTATTTTTSAGTYTVTVTDPANGCTSTASTTVTENTTPTTIFCERYRIYDHAASAWGPWTAFSGNCVIELCENEGLDDIQFDGGPDINTGWVWTDEDNNVDSEVDELVVFSNIDASDAGTYTGTLTDQNGCVSTLSFTVVVNTNPIATATNDGPITCADPTVTMTATPSGMTYAWSGGGTAATKDVTTAGTYVVTVTDTNGCSSTAETIVSEDTLSPSADAGPDQTICEGESVALSATGGVSYNWNQGLGSGSGPTVTPSTTTSYTVTVTAANGCTDTDQVIVNVTPNPIADLGDNGSICSGESHTWTAVDAGVGASYTWDFGTYATPSTATGIGPHVVTYNLVNLDVNQSTTTSLTVSLNGCTSIGTDAFTLLAIPVTSVSYTDPGCDVNDGSITISFNDSPNRTGIEFSIDGGTSWPVNVDDNTGSYVFSGLAAGSYDVVVRWGDDSCPGVPQNIILDPFSDITDPGSISGGSSQCSSFNPAAITSVAGASGGSGSSIEYEWEYRQWDCATGYFTTWSAVSGSSNSVTYDPASISVSTEYRRKARRAGCTTWQESNTVLFAVFENGNAGSIGGDQSFCVSGNPPAFSSTPATGGCYGTLEYQWQWRPGTTGTWTDLVGETSETRDIGAVTSTRQYRRLARWSSLCPWLESNIVTITINDEPLVAITAEDWMCVNWSRDLTAVGTAGSGTGYTYAWDNGLGAGATHSVSPTVTTTYTVTVTDSNGCTNTASHVLEVRDIITDFGSIAADQENCGAFDPAILIGTGITTSGPNITPAYQWEVSTDNSLWTNVTGATSKDYDPPMTSVTTYYRRRAYMNNSCGNATTNVVTITVHSTFSATAINDGPITCFDPAVTLTANPTGMSYSWSGGGAGRTKSVTTAGTYIVTITDGNGCTSTAQTIVSEDTATPTANAGANQTVCSGDNVSLTATGGGTYSWSTGHTTAVISITPTYTATYTVTVTSVNGCTDTDQVNVIIDNVPTTPYAGPDQDICQGESLSLSIDQTLFGGGQIDHTTWQVGTGSSGNFSRIGTDNENHRLYSEGPWGESSIVWEARPDANDNADGGWNMNAVSIDHTKAYRVSVWVNRKVKGTDGRFYMGVYGNGSVNGVRNVTNGGLNANPYFWYSTPGATDMPEDEWVLVVGHIYPSDHTGTSLHAESGRYTVSAGKIGSNYIDFKWLPETNTARPRTYLFYATDQSARQQWTYPRFDVLDGNEPSIDVLLNGYDSNQGLAGAGSWEWFTGSCGGTSAGSGTSITVNPTVTTTYYVRGQNHCGNSVCDEVVVTVNTPPVATVSKDGDITCADPAITLTATPAGMTYAWSGGGTSQTKDVSTPGTHSVTVTDSNGCTDVATINVIENTTPTSVSCERYRVRDAVTNTWGPWISFSGSCTLEMCENEGLDDIQIDGGPDINTGWVWTDESNNVDSEVDEIVQFTNIGANDAGTYTGILTNEYGCTSTVTVSVVVHENPAATASNNGPITCNQPTVTLTADPAGMTYAWSGGGSAKTKEVTAAGTYMVTVTDTNGCSSTAQTIVTEDTAPPVADAGADQTICRGDDITLTASGGYSYEWDQGLGLGASHMVSPNGTTVYTVTVTDTNGCTNTDEVMIIVNTALVFNVVKATDLGCDGSCTGSFVVYTSHAATGDYNVTYTHNGSTHTIGPFMADSAVIDGLCAGSYTGITTQAITTGCADIWGGSNVTIQQTSADWEHVNLQSEVSDCDGACDGSFIVDANLAATGDFNITYIYEGSLVQLGPYSFAGDIVIDGLCAGTYSDITIISVESGCIDVWPTAIVVNEPTPTASVTSFVDDACLAGDGTATVNMSGGMAPYTIEWESVDGSITGSGIRSAQGNYVISNLLGGHTYCITVTDTNGCSSE